MADKRDYYEVLGLQKGASVFEMADVNFLFVSPLNPKHILAYGLLNQALKGISASVFVLFMGQTLHSLWGISLGGLLLLFGGYVLALVLFQLLSICIYMYVKGRERMKVAVTVVCALFLVPVVLAIAQREGMAELAAWLSENTSAYARFILTGEITE